MAKRKRTSIMEEAFKLSASIREYVRDDGGKFSLRGGSQLNGKQPHWVAPPTKKEVKA